MAVAVPMLVSIRVSQLSTPGRAPGKLEADGSQMISGSDAGAGERNAIREPSVRIRAREDQRVLLAVTCWLTGENVTAIGAVWLSSSTPASLALKLKTGLPASSMAVRSSGGQPLLVTLMIWVELPNTVVSLRNSRKLQGVISPASASVELMQVGWKMEFGAALATVPVR